MNRGGGYQQWTYEGIPVNGLLQHELLSEIRKLQ